MTTLTAGPLQVQYENGFLRYICWGDHELIRMVYFALRDENWETIPHHITGETMHAADGTFEIGYTATHSHNGRDILRWAVTISGTRDGTLSFSIDGEVLQDFDKNRAGFCVLHPPGTCAGQPVQITHDNGIVIQTHFPLDISPANPFTHVRAMQWTVASHRVTLAFAGDIFETEDQRNWTDASFKTFCTPLSDPFPVRIGQGDRIQQQVTLTAALPSPQPRRHTIEITRHPAARVPLPSIGVCDTPVDTAILQTMPFYRIPFDHYRVDVHLADARWVSAFSDACTRAAALQWPLEVVLHVDGKADPSADAFVMLCQQNRIVPKYLLLLANDNLVTSPLVSQAVGKLKQLLPYTQVGVGTDFNFTELNRHPLHAGAADFISYAVQPQEHAFDDRSLVENVAAQYDTAVSAARLHPGKAVHVSPVTLRRRFNPYATNPQKRIATQAERVDTRQVLPFLEAWTLASIKYLAEGGAAAITYYETVGALGIVSDDGTPYPVLDAFRKVLSMKSSAIVPSASSHPLIADALFFENGKGIIWNYTASEQLVTIDGGGSTALDAGAIVMI